MLCRLAISFFLLPLLASGETTKQQPQIEFTVPAAADFVRSPAVWFASTIVPFRNFSAAAGLAHFQSLAQPLANTPDLANSQVLLTKVAFVLSVAKPRFVDVQLFDKNLAGFFPNLRMSAIPGTRDIRSSSPLPAMARMTLGTNAVECTMRIGYTPNAAQTLGTGTQLCWNFNVLFRASASQYEFFEVPGRGDLVVAVVRATSFVRQDTLNNFGPIQGILVSQLRSRILTELQEFRANMQKTLR